jgi:hypothetical protein
MKQSIANDRDDMDLVGNDVDTLHEEIEHLIGHLVGNDVNTLHEEKNHLVGFSFIRVTRRIPRALPRV